MSEWAEGVEILWGFKQMLKVSTFYLEKNPKNIWFKP